jgi:hypothetical protein
MMVNQQTWGILVDLCWTSWFTSTPGFMVIRFSELVNGVCKSTNLTGGAPCGFKIKPTANPLMNYPSWLRSGYPQIVIIYIYVYVYVSVYVYLHVYVYVYVCGYGYGYVSVYVYGYVYVYVCGYGYGYLDILVMIWQYVSTVDQSFHKRQWWGTVQELFENREKRGRNCENRFAHLSAILFSLHQGLRVFIVWGRHWRHDSFRHGFCAWFLAA